MTNETFLRKLGEAGLEKKCSDIRTSKLGDYHKRFMSEWKLIVDLGYTDYFLIVWDIVKWAKDNGILCAPARGSVAGSLLAYLTDITDVDPITFATSFIVLLA